MRDLLQSCKSPGLAGSRKRFQSFKRAYDNCLAGNGQRFSQDFYYPGWDFRHMGVYLQPVYDRAGEVIGTLIVGRDITDLHKAQQGLKQAHADRSHILENANISIALVKDRKVVQADQPEQIL